MGKITNQQIPCITFLTKKALPSKEADRFLKLIQIGTACSEKLEGEGAVWDTIKKKKFITLVCNYKTVCNYN